MVIPQKSAVPRQFSSAARDAEALACVRADAALVLLLDALQHLSSHPDDATAIAALDLLEALRPAAPTINAQDFQCYYYRIHDRSLAHGDPARPEWRQAHRLAADALQALLWVWRAGGADARTAADTMPVGIDAESPHEMECGR